MSEHPSQTETPSLASRLVERLRSIEPMTLGLLGVLSFPGELFEELAFMQIFGIFFLFFLWPFVAPVVGAVRMRLTDEESAGPRDWLAMGGPREHLVFLGSLPLTVLNPLTFTQDVSQFAGSAVAFVRHGGSLPAPESYDQSVRYRLPVEGTWTVVNGSPIKEYSHSWLPVTQRYAYDFVITDEEGRTRPENANTSLENYYCYDEPVLAPADGVVVEVCDSDLESPRAGGFSHPFKRSITGNYVVIQHADSEYSTLAHLVPGSVTVEPGDRVERGQQVARCGHSGNSSEPHLHFQLQDHPTFEIAAGLPVAFDDVTVDTPGMNVAENVDWADGRDDSESPGRYVHVGQRVTHEPGRASNTHEPDRESPSNGTETAITQRDRDGITPVQGSAATLGRVGVGLSVGGFLTVAGGILTSSWPAIAALLAAAGVLGVCYRYVLLAVGEFQPRSGSLGVPVGVLLAAVAAGAVGTLDAAGPEPGRAGAVLFLVGFLASVVVSEYGRRNRREVVTDAVPS